MGAFGGWYFGERPHPPVVISTLVWGVVIGPIPIFVFSLFYDYQGRFWNLTRPLLVSLILIPFLAMLGILGLQSLGIGEAWFYRMGSTTGRAIGGGAIIGLRAGFILGLQTGLTLLLYRLWPAVMEPIS